MARCALLCARELGSLAQTPNRGEVGASAQARRASPKSTKGERMDGDDMTYDNLFDVQPEPPPWPDEAEARIAALEAKVRQLETLVHRLMNADATQENEE